MKWLMKVVIVTFGVMMGLTCGGAIISSVVQSHQKAVAAANTPEQRVAEAKQQATAQQAREAKENDDYHRGGASVLLLLSDMKDPESTKITEVLVVPSNAVCINYRSKNGFSGYRIGYATLTPKGNLHRSPDGADTWNKYCADKTGTVLDLDVLNRMTSGKLF